MTNVPSCPVAMASSSSSPDSSRPARSARPLGSTVSASATGSSDLQASYAAVTIAAMTTRPVVVTVAILVGLASPAAADAFEPGHGVKLLGWTSDGTQLV